MRADRGQPDADPSLSTAVITQAVVLLALAFASVSIPSAASADAIADRYEQYRYAQETLSLSYEAYVKRQENFRAAGCTNGWTDPGGTSAHCNKPSPYNQFDWTDDGCSGRN